jgi:hypothetical protein
VTVLAVPVLVLVLQVLQMLLVMAMVMVAVVVGSKPAMAAVMAVGPAMMSTQSRRCSLWQPCGLCIASDSVGHSFVLEQRVHRIAPSAWAHTSSVAAACRCPCL